MAHRLDHELQFRRCHQQGMRANRGCSCYVIRRSLFVHGCNAVILNTITSSFACDNEIELCCKKRFLADTTIWRGSGGMLDEIDNQRFFHAEHRV